ncbi:MAG: histone family protein [Nitrososphaerota archaeon]|nr:histone family protein [Nitrososphaerota archaeon]MDG7048564.1 histone family protein [Nitrososphaerota archaeon]MDG7051094.1 histone family protein [Nitrososphaerota archaeon]
MPEIPSAAIYRIFKKGGAERVAQDAISELTKYLEEYGVLIVKQASDLADHAGRKTVMEDDVKLAIRNITGSNEFKRSA